MHDYPDTWYRTTMVPNRARPSLTGNLDVDICVIGAGLAGLTTALELSRSGQAVAIIEAKRAGWGASGRNAGFVSPGFAQDMDKIITRNGMDTAKALYQLSLEGAEYVRANVAELAPAAQLGTGSLSATRHDDAQSMTAHIRQLAETFEHQLEYWPTGKLREHLRSERYFHGAYDAGGFHIHPLNYVLAMAEAVESTGGRIYENSPALALEQTPAGHIVRTQNGAITTRHVVLAVSAYDRKLYRPLARALVPVATYIAATVPLGDRAGDAIRTPAAIADTRRAGDYYRLALGNRILWGGRISARTREPWQLAEIMRKDMVSVYPQLAGVAMQHAWSGLMGYFRHAMPVIGELQPGLWAATGFGGQGLNTTAMAGLVIARGITGLDDAWKHFSIYGPAWAGGPLAPAATQATYWFMQARDRLDER